MIIMNELNLLFNVTEDSLKISNIYYKLYKLPPTIRAFVTQINQDTLILINDKLSIEQQKKAFTHELLHIYADHLEEYNYTNQYRTFCEDQIKEAIK